MITTEEKVRILLGMLYLGICKDLTIKYGEQNEMFENVVRKYAVA